ncbi:MAG: DUF3299 domain-containing protein [Betaproteobacteria bacterium]|nr:DUF3299 domain-containing protein [Betaproteobacteria bacterium]
MKLFFRLLYRFPGCLAALVWMTVLPMMSIAQQPGQISDDQLLSYIGKEPPPPGTLAWQLLRQVKLVEVTPRDAKGTMRPEFSAAVKVLDKQPVKLYGFVLPLSTGGKQTHFLLSPLPTHCPYCVSQGPDSMVEVLAKSPVEYNQWEPIVVSGKLELVNDPYLFYRLTNAEVVKP